MSAATILQLFREVERNHASISQSYDRDCEKLYDYYRGRHSKWMDPIIAATYPNAAKSGMRSLAMPFIARIIDSTATLFHRPPLWHLKKDGETLPTSSKDAKVWAEIDTMTRLTSRLKLGQRTARRDKTVFVGPAWRRKRLCLDVYRPSQVYVLPDPLDPSDLDAAQAVVTRSGAGWMVWTAKEYGYVTETSTDEYVCSDPLRTKHKNPYKEIPLVALHDQPGDDLHAPLDDSLITGQEALNQLWTANVWAMGQGFVLNVLYSDSDVDSDDMVAGPDRVVVVSAAGGTTKMERLAAELDPKGMIEFSSSLLRTYAVLHAADPGIFSIDTEVFANALSGIAKQVDRMDLQAIREDSERDWEYSLHSLFAKTRAVWNFHVKSARRLNKELELEVEWVEPQPAGNALQEAQAERLRLEDGTATEAEILAKREGISVEEAEERLNGKRT